MKSSIFNFNKVFFVGLFSSVITAALGYAFRLLILYYTDYDLVSYNLSEFMVSLSYFCSLGGIRFVINESLKDTFCLMSTSGGGSSSNPYRFIAPAPSSNNPAPTNNISSNNSSRNRFRHILPAPTTNNPVPTNYPSSNNPSSNPVTTSNNVVKVTIDKNYSGKNYFVGHYTDRNWKLTRLFVAIDSNLLHSSDGKHYLGNWLCEFREKFFEVKDIDSTFEGQEPKLYHMGVANKRDKAKITDYINSVNNNHLKDNVRKLPLDAKLIDELLRNN